MKLTVKVLVTTNVQSCDFLSFKISFRVMVKMHVSTAAFEASTDTSVDEQHDGSQDDLGSCDQGDEMCIVRERFLRSRQGPVHQQLSSQRLADKLKVKRGLVNNDPTCDPSLLPSESTKRIDAPLKQVAHQGPIEYQQQQGQGCQPNCKQMREPAVSQHLGEQVASMDPVYQQGQKYGNGVQCQQQGRQEAGDSLNHLSAQLRSVLDFSRLPSLEEALSPSGNLFTLLLRAAQNLR